MWKEYDDNPCLKINGKGNKVHKLLLFGHRSLSRNTTQRAVINIFKIRILLNLTFRMFVHIHFQKYNHYGFWEAIYTTKIGVWNLDRDDLQ